MCSCQRGFLLENDNISCIGNNCVIILHIRIDAINFAQMLMSVVLMGPAVKTVLTLLAVLYVPVVVVMHWTVMAGLAMVNFDPD